MIQNPNNVFILPEQTLMSFLTGVFRDLSDTWQVKTSPLLHSVRGIWSWLVTATRPSAPMLMTSLVDGDLDWDSEDHLIWGLKPHAEHKSLFVPETSLGSRRSSTDATPKWAMNQCINEWVYYIMKRAWNMKSTVIKGKKSCSSYQRSWHKSLT